MPALHFKARWSSIALGLGLFVTVVNLASTILILKAFQRPSYGTYFKNGTVNSLPLHIETVAYTLEDTLHYQIAAPSAWGEWDSLKPNGGGWIHLGDQYEQTVGLSMFHQLHCLDSLRKAWWDKPYNDKHVQHCFTYLRQSLLCLSDTTLEPFSTLEDGHIGGNGLGMTHVCRNWEQVYQFAEENHAAYLGHLDSTKAP